MDIRELLVHIRAETSNRQVARDIGLDRRTVQRYREWATAQDLLADPLPPMDKLQALLEQTMPAVPPPQNISSVEPYRDLVAQLVRENVEAAAIHGRLTERGYSGSYSAVHRFVSKLRPHTPDTTVRVERQPGEEGQVDFGYAGRLLDPTTHEPRRAWAFVLTLAWSRHQYVEFVFDQTVETWLRVHRNAFTWLGGVPQRVVVDNLKAAIVKAVWDDPAVQQSYRDCALHYGFRIAPCRPYTPEHKLAVWKKVTLHRDCYVQFEQAYYSAPYQLVEQEVWVCGGLQQVRIYNLKHELVATHERAQHPGERQTHLDHLPPEKVPGLTLDRDASLVTAAAIGPATYQVMQTLLDDPVLPAAFRLDRLPTVGRLLRLQQRFGAARLEAACQRALQFADPAYKTIKRILTQGLEDQPALALVPTPAASAFVRSPAELVGDLAGGESWN